MTYDLKAEVHSCCSFAPAPCTRHPQLAFHTMDVVTRAEGDTGAEARRPAPPTDAEAADATLYQDVVFLYRLVPGAYDALFRSVSLMPYYAHSTRFSAKIRANADRRHVHDTDDDIGAGRQALPTLDGTPLMCRLCSAQLCGALRSARRGACRDTGAGCSGHARPAAGGHLAACHTVPMADAFLNPKWIWCQVDPCNSPTAPVHFAVLHPLGRWLAAVGHRDSRQWCTRCRAGL